MSERGLNDDVPAMDSFAEEQGMEDVEFVEAPEGYDPKKGGLEEESEKDKKIVLSAEEYAALREGGDTSKAILSGLKELAGGFGVSNSPANVPQQQVGESEEEFAKRLEASFLEEGKGAKVIFEAVDRRLGKSMGAILDEMREQNKKLVRLDPETQPILNRWGDEVEKVVKGLPLVQQRNPKVWEYAVGEVKKRHAGELENESITEKVNAGVKAALEELGIDVEKLKGEKEKSGKRTSFGGGIGSSRSGSANAGGKGGQARKTIPYTKEEAARAEREGLDIKDYLRAIGRI